MFGLHSVKGLDAIPNALCWVQLAQLSKCTKTGQCAEIVTAQSEMCTSIVDPRMIYTWCVNPGSSYNADSILFGNCLFALYFFICEMTDLRVSGLRLRLWLKTNAWGSKVVCTQLEWQRPHTRIFFSSVLLASIWWVGYVGYTRCREGILLDILTTRNFTFISIRFSFIWNTIALVNDDHHSYVGDECI